MTRKRILITGGLGFIGRNLYYALANDQHDITILADNIYNDIDDRQLLSDTIQGSILDKQLMDRLVPGYDVIFSLAGSSGASHSIRNPYHDLDANLRGHLNILEACRKHNPSARLVFPSSRLVYGKSLYNPVNEDHPIVPESIYAIHKLTTEHYYLLYHRVYKVPCVIFRISNPYGPYQRFGSNQYGILNWFIHKAITGEAIEIFGEGKQKRDFIYIDDVTDLLRMSVDGDQMIGNIYNVGFGKGIALAHAAGIIARNIPGTKIQFKPWPDIDQMIETGDYVSDIGRLKNAFNWEPKISFEDGIKKTIEFYGERK